MGVICSSFSYTRGTAINFPKRSIQSVNASAAKIRISYTLAIFWNFADVFIFQEIFRILMMFSDGIAARVRIILQEFLRSIYFPKIFSKKNFQEILRLKKIEWIHSLFYLKSKEKNLYIYVYVLRIRIYIHIYIHITYTYIQSFKSLECYIKSKRLLAPRVVTGKGRSPRRPEATAGLQRKTATASIHI